MSGNKSVRERERGDTIKIFCEACHQRVTVLQVQNYKKKYTEKNIYFKILLRNNCATHKYYEMYRRHR